MSTPPPTPVVIAALNAMPEVADYTDRVSTVLLTPTPALRVTKVGDAEVPSAASIAPLFQVEVWADDEIEAEALAWRIADAWPRSTGEVIGSAYVHGRWLDAMPFPSPNPFSAPDLTVEMPRFLFTVGLRLSGVSP